MNDGIVNKLMSDNISLFESEIVVTEVMAVM